MPEAEEEKYLHCIREETEEMSFSDTEEEGKLREAYLSINS